jgi:hypothetical protein
MRTTAIEALMRHAIDYAGMFPPASLPLTDALAEYARVRGGAHGWALGAFVVSSAHVGELTPGLKGPANVRDVPLAMVMREPSPSALDEVIGAASRLTIAAVEFPPMPAAGISTAAAAVPSGIRAYFEVAPGAEMQSVLDAVAAAGACAKIRTGGTTSDAFPDATAVYHFLQSCLARHIVCKATAGLHHAFAGRYPLTYEQGSSSASMFGFFTLSAMAALVYIGAPKEDSLALLTESQPDAITLDADGMCWRDYRVSSTDLETMRRSLFSSFGSCSAQEPIDDLTRMHLL